MPSAWARVAIVIFWVVMTQDLVRNDLVPNLVLGPPPDFRSLTERGGDGTSRWTLLALDSKGGAERPVGDVETETHRRTDGSFRLASTARFQTGALLQGSPLQAIQDTRLKVVGSCEIAGSGNLESFRLTVLEDQTPPSNILVIDGRIKGDRLIVSTQSPLPLFGGTKEFSYRPHSMVQSSLGPLDAMPGLQVGQRWESRVVNPFSGKVETGTAEVVGRQHIHWNQNPIPTFVIVTRTGPISARTWVRTDGLVIRQEVPLLLVKLVLERVPDQPGRRMRITR
jgi:hypothetical protein